MAPELLAEARRLKKRSEFLERAAVKALAEVDQMYAERSECLESLQELCRREPELAKVLAAIE